MTALAHPPSGPHHLNRLDSWKAIADYFGRSVRTVMRWERDRNLPVHHMPGGGTRTVFALVDELDAWMAGEHGVAAAAEAPVAVAVPLPDSSPTVWHRRHPWLVGALVLTGLAVVGTVAMMPLGGRSPEFAPIATATMVERLLVSSDAAGREVWRYELPEGTTNLGTRGARVVDIDSDGRPDVLVPLQAMRSEGDGTGALLAIDSRGTRLWQRSLDDTYRFGATDYGPTWFPENAIVYHHAGAVRITATMHHNTWWPDIVATFDATGKVFAKFVNTGWLFGLNLTRDGRYLLASGVSNAFDGAVLVVLDAANPGGTAPSDGGSLPACVNCPPGAPRAYVVVPWSDLARPAALPTIIVQVSDDGTIQLRAQQRPPGAGAMPEIIIGLSPSLEVVERTVSDTFREAHDVLARSGELDHATTACPWLTPPVRVWTADRGWRAIK